MHIPIKFIVSHYTGIRYYKARLSPSTQSLDSSLSNKPVREQIKIFVQVPYIIKPFTLLEYLHVLE